MRVSATGLISLRCIHTKRQRKDEVSLMKGMMSPRRRGKVVYETRHLAWKNLSSDLNQEVVLTNEHNHFQTTGQHNPVSFRLVNTTCLARKKFQDGTLSSSTQFDAPTFAGSLSLSCKHNRSCEIFSLHPALHRCEGLRPVTFYSIIMSMSIPMYSIIKRGLLP